MRIPSITLALLSVIACRAWSQSAPPIDAKAMLEDLKTIKEKVATETKVGRNRIIQQLNAAAASDSTAIEFYQEAVRATQFDGQPREQTQFQDWKKKEKDKLHSRDLQEAARLHLNYLMLTLQYASGVEVKDLLPALINYTKQVSADLSALSDQDLMKRALGAGIFVRWFQLEPMIADAKDWEMVPSNVDGIFGKTILPELRRQKDPRVLEYWDLRIQRGANEAQQSMSAFNADSFEQTRKPSLLWHRAQDQLAIGQRNQAIAEMFAIIKKYPAHADCAQWISQLEAILSGAGGEATATE